MAAAAAAGDARPTSDGQDALTQAGQARSDAAARRLHDYTRGARLDYGARQPCRTGCSASTSSSARSAGTPHAVTARQRVRCRRSMQRYGLIVTELISYREAVEPGHLRPPPGELADRGRRVLQGEAARRHAGGDRLRGAVRAAEPGRSAVLRVHRDPHRPAGGAGRVLALRDARAARPWSSGRSPATPCSSPTTSPSDLRRSRRRRRDRGDRRPRRPARSARSTT